MTPAARRAGSRYLNSYDKLVERVISVQSKLAERSKGDAMQSLVQTQVGLTRQVSSAYSSAARKLIS